jgi:vancomycin permeability regulator SanA
MRILRRLTTVALFAVLTVGLVVQASDLWVAAHAKGRIYSAQAVPPAPVVLVLGAQVVNGSPSQFLVARLEIARTLIESGKAQVVLASGDHMNWDYDEPAAMRTWLVDRGVPERRVVLDYAGFDTYDSCSRAVRIFGVTRAIVVTQLFHLPRAIAVCRQVGLDAVGVGDETARQFTTPWLRGSVREEGAAVKAVYDVVSGRDPVHLGPHEPGVDNALHSPGPSSRVS